MDDLTPRRPKLSEEEKFTSNRRVYNRAYRRVLGCSRCKPNQGENRNRTARDDRYKSVRKGRCTGDANPRARDKKGRPLPKNGGVRYF